MHGEAGHDGGLDPRLLDESAEWLMRLNATAITAEERAAFEHWRQRSPAHARAWARAEVLLGKLQDLPAPLAMPSLDRPQGTRRRVLVSQLGKLAALLAVAPTGWLVWRELEGRGWGADYRTVKGEQRDIHLPDGSRILLNTATAIDVRFDAAQRLVRLRAGEILVETGHPTPTHSPRPFHVETAHGRLEALGTRFMVRQDPTHARLSVFEGAVRIELPQAQARPVLRPGEQTEFSSTGVRPILALRTAASAWTRGLLLADQMPLAELAAELSRYRPGVIQCDDTVADLPVTGSYPIGSPGGTEITLDMLAAAYPLEVTRRLGGWWVMLQARRTG